MSINYEKELNPEQFRAVREASGPSLVLAGAGSGKTRTIVYRVAYLLEQSVNPGEILLLTFTNKAAREMRSRVEFLIGRGSGEIWGGTFHHVAARLLRKYGHLLRYKQNFSILDQDDSRNLIKLAISETGIDPKARRFPSPAVLQDIFSFSRNTKQSIGAVLSLKHSSWLKLEQEIQNVFRTYSDKKRASNAMDFDDLLLNWVLLLHSQVSVREALQAKWRHILVDEYQDTNPSQGELIRLLYSTNLVSELARPAPLDAVVEEPVDSSGQGGIRRGNIYERSIMVVGDDAQSIYSFRGATIDNILEFPREFADTKIFRLETNYRSTTPILNLANTVIEANERQFEKKLRGVEPVGEKPNLVVAPTAANEAEFIAEKILELRDQGTAMNKIVVLFRAAYQSESLEFELAKRDIPYEYRGGVRFFERAHIKDVIAYLRILANPRDEVSWLRILNFVPGIGAVTASRIFSIIREAEDLKEIADQKIKEFGARVESGWEEFKNIFEKLTKLQSSPPKDIIGVILNSGYADYLEREYPDWRERLDDLEQLKVFASGYENINDFVGEISLYEHFGAKRAGAASNDEEMLVLSTIHQAKGLEWDAVFIISLLNSAFPNRRALLEEGGLEEERRLFYVAITRAKKMLFLTYPLVGGVDNVFLNQPSMFLNEIDQDLLQVIQVQNNDSNDNFESDLPVIDAAGRRYLRDISEL
jgi:DNA helicase-2/ATP-dependent DNA helicase PcrA